MKGSFYAKRRELEIVYKQNLLYFLNIQKCTDIEFLTSKTLVHRYLPVCSDIKNETSR